MEEAAEGVAVEDVGKEDKARCKLGTHQVVSSSFLHSEVSASAGWFNLHVGFLRHFVRFLDTLFLQ